LQYKKDVLSIFWNVKGMNINMDKNIFRNSDKLEVFSTEKLDEVMVVVTPSAWILKAIAILIVLMLSYWISNFRIDNSLELSGMLIPKNSIEEADAPIGREIRNESELRGIFFLPFKDKQLIDKNKDISIITLQPNSSETYELDGKITSISKYPATYESLKNKIPSRELINTFLGDGPVVEVDVNLKGKVKNLSDGVFCKAKIVLDSKNLADLLLSEYK
jgi:hypothetical protein